MPAATWTTQNYIGIRLFAGAPNPRWAEPQAFFDALKREILALPIRVQSDKYLVPNSWYGGVAVHLVEGGKRRLFVIHAEHVFDSASEVVRLDAGRHLEQRLFRALPVNFMAVVNKLEFQNAIVVLNEEKSVIGAAPGQPKPSCEGAPVFQPAPPKSKWDRHPGISDNNCYNYANNEFSNIDDAQPGRQGWTPVTEAEMHARLISDGLVAVGANPKTLPAHCSTAASAHLIAVCLRDRRGTRLENGVQQPVFHDYHCFRLDKSGGGRWSHKDGESPSTENDNREAGFPLDNLATAIFKLEHVLVGYYWSIPGTRNIGPPV
ncbi:MAG: hypothetical protein ABI665_05060 [Vicinamibacterales bacterium]